MKAFKEKSYDLQRESVMRKMMNCSSNIMPYKRELIKVPILGFYSMTSSSALRRCRRDTYFSTINCSVAVCLQLKRAKQRDHTNSSHIWHALPSTDHCRRTTSRWTDCEG